MMRYRTCALALLVAVSAVQPRAGAAQPPAEPQPVEAPPPPVEPVGDIDRDFRRQVFRLGTDYVLHSGDSVREVVVVMGDATIEGHVRQSVVVVLGTATLAGTASIERDLIVVGGKATVAPSARVGGALVVVAGGVEAPDDFAPGGEQVIIGPSSLGGRLGALNAWLIRGVLLGRPIVPDLLWVWAIVGVLFLVYLVIGLLFDRSVSACAVTLGQKPLTTFGAGLLVLLLLGPVSLLLAVTVVGIAVIPVVVCALLVGAIVGKVGVARWIGSSIVPESEPTLRSQAVRSFAIGFAVIAIAYMIPVLGFVTWTLTSVLAIGAATLAFTSAYRRENPPPPQPVVPLVVAPVTAGDAAATWEGEAPPIAVPRPTVSIAPAPVADTDVVALPRAYFRDRLFAFILDIVLVLIAFQWLDRFGEAGEYFLWLLVYHIGFWTWKGTTVGGIICQLRVVRVDGTPVRFIDALVRGLSSIFSLAVLGIGCLWILKDPDRQAWHDRIAGTYVIKVPRDWPL
jgi:uncharacterized RDD family membrane protein YckC